MMMSEREVSKIEEEVLTRLLDSYIYRNQAVQDLCKGKKVLHLGYLCHADWEEKLNAGSWLHGSINKVATRLIGLDYLPDAVERANSVYGFEGYAWDVMELDRLALEETFDVIVCGELIEHLANPGLMLAGVSRFMAKEAKLIVTTPNVWYIRRPMLTYAYQEKNKLNREHVMWQSYWTLKYLLERYGYDELAYGYYASEKFTDKKGIKSLIWRIIIKITPRRCHRGLFFVAKRNV